jgi:hypothetical protein
MPRDVGDSGTARLRRRSECDTLEALLDSVRAGQSREPVVPGVADIDTSALLDDVTRAPSGCEGRHH